MKKEYINPITTIYKIRVSNVLAASLPDGGPDDGSGDAESRENYTESIDDNNRGSIWDNAW
jgi:hypothetical protein